MHLLCKVCGATQPVNVADEADEDPRTQAIRRSFRAEHLACGEASVSLQLHAVNAAPPVDFSPQAWTMAAPEGITLNGGDGYFYDGSGHRVCEDCWQPIPRYVDFPLGLTSPESNKPRASNVDSHAGYEQLSKALCLPCYLDAFARVYPGAERPQFRADVIGDAALERRLVAAHQTTVDAGFYAEPKAV